jgi:AAA domain
MRAAASFYDDQLAALADRSAAEAVGLLFDSVPTIVSDGQRYQVVVVAAPAGAGKTEFVCSVAAEVVARNHGRAGTVVVATPTNDQAYELVRRIALRVGPAASIAFVPANGKSLPVATAALPNVAPAVKAVDARHHAVVVGTLDKLGDANARGDLSRDFSYLVIDEAYQAHSAHYFGVGGLAARHLLVGDPGQLDPFTTMEDPDRWRGLPEDPTQTAVAVVRRNHPAIPVVRLPITRRLPPSAVPLVGAFYPGHRFRAWTLPGARAMRLIPSVGGRSTAMLDQALDKAAAAGWAYLRQPGSPVLTADPTTVDVVTRLVERLMARVPALSSERTGGVPVQLTADRVAVAVSHNDQKDLLRASLDSAGLASIRVDTANRLQGLEFDVVVAWHPLAGLPQPDGFHLDPGRLCVMMTRHRHACILVGRADDADLLESVPPPAEAWLGHEGSSEVDGWFAHRLVFDQLAAHSIDLR